MLACWLIPGLLYYLPNNGGSGLMMPQDILSWWWCGAIALIIALCHASVRFIPRCAQFTSLLLLCGAAMWSLPSMWAPSRVAFNDGLAHVLALWGLLALLWLLRLMPERLLRMNSWLKIIWIAALAQAIFSFLQVTVFSRYGGYAGTRPVGIFQQVNVLASFLATGFICMLVCLHQWRKFSHATRAIAVCSLLFFPFMLVLLQSRAGMIGALASGLLLTIIAARSGESCRQLATVWTPVLAGIALALAWQHGLINMLFPQSGGGGLSLPDSFSIRDTSGSTHERWNIIKNTWLMICQHPWLGTGYGGFESAFARTAIKNGGAVVGFTLIHPHNEILYAWAEGGLVALTGLLMMVTAILVSLWRRGGLRWTGLALLLPIAVHMNLEYPLYQSVPHGVVVVLLLSLVIPPARRRDIESKPDRLWLGRTLRIFTGICGLGLMIIMSGTLHTQQALTQAERTNMTPATLDSVVKSASLFSQKVFESRIDYDRHIALLIQYNQSKDPNLLKQFVSWADEYLMHRNDPNVMASRLTIGMALSPEDMSSACQRARLLWPHDERMRCHQTGASE